MFRSLSLSSFHTSPTIRLIGLISFFGQLYFFVPVMTPYLLQRHLTIAEIAGLQTMLLLAGLVMEIPTGVIADRLGHVWSYRIALMVLALGEFLFLFARDYPAFLAIQFLTGTGFAFASGSVDAIIYDSLPPGDRTSAMQRAKGFHGAATQTGSVVAYSIGGIITADLTLDRMTVTIVMGAIAVTIAAMLSFLLKPPVVETEIAKIDSFAILGTAFRTIRGNPGLRRIILSFLITEAFGAHLLVFYQQYFLETGVSGIWFGWALSLASILVVLVQLHAWRLQPLVGITWSIIIAKGIPGLLYLAMAMNGLAWLAVVLFIVQWGAMHVCVPIYSGLFNAHLPDEVRATGLSLISAMLTGYISLGGILLGTLADRSLPMTFALMGVVILVGTVVFRVDDRHLAHQEASATRTI